MALYISAGRRRRTTIIVGVAAAIVGLLLGFLLGRGTATTEIYTSLFVGSVRCV